MNYAKKTMETIIMSDAMQDSERTQRECNKMNKELPVGTKEFNANMNAALLFLDRALQEIESGFVPCARCGDQEETKNLDFVDDLKEAKVALLRVVYGS